MSKFNLKNNENYLNELANKVQAFKDASKVTIGDKEVSVSLSLIDIANYINNKDFDVPTNEDELEVMVQTVMDYIVDNVAKNVNEACLLEGQNQELDLSKVSLASQELSLAIINTICEKGLEGVVVNHDTSFIKDSLDEIIDNLEDTWDHYYVARTQNVFEQNSKTLFEQKYLASTNVENKSQLDNDYATLLNNQINEQKALLRFTIQDESVQTQNIKFNNYLQEVSANYTMVHELYNQKGFWGKWFTSEGRALRNAMNGAKDLTKTLYKLVSVANDYANHGMDGKFQVTPSKNIPFDVSKTMLDFTNNQKLKLMLNDDLKAVGAEVVTHKDVNNRVLLTDDEDINELDARVINVDEEIERLDLAEKSNDEYTKGHEDFYKEVDELEEKIKNANKLDVIAEVDEVEDDGAVVGK